MEFLRKASISVYSVAGIPVNFKEVPLSTVLKIRNLSKGCEALAKLLAYFFVDKSKDTEVITKDEVVDPEKGIVNRITQMSAVNPSIASMRQRDLEQGIAGVQALITSPESQELMCEIIYHSAFEEWKAKKISLETATAEIQSLDFGTFLDLMHGAIKAHKGVLTGLGKWFPPVKNVAEKLEKAAEGL